MKGFNRLKGVATASVMGLGVIVAGSGRAASVSTSTTMTKALAATVQGVDLKGSLVIYFSTSYFSLSEYSVVATASIQTTGGSNTTDAYTDAFDGVLMMEVDGNLFLNPDNSVDLTGNVITSDTVVDIVAGVDAQIQYAFNPSQGGDSLGVFRALYTLTNTTAAAISTTVNINGNLGSDDSTTIQSSSSGDTVADDTDMWTVSTDTNLGVDPKVGDDPGLVITRYGTGASVTPTQTSVLGSTADTDTFANDYDLTIPAMSTQRVLVFIEAHKTNAGAAASAAGFETLAAANTAGHLAGLSATQLSEIVNYSGNTSVDADLDGVPDATDNCPADVNTDQADKDGDGIGDVCDPTDDTPADDTPADDTPADDTPAASISKGDGLLGMSLPGLLAMFGMLPVLRLFRKTKR